MLPTQRTFSVMLKQILHLLNFFFGIVKVIFYDAGGHQTRFML